MNAKELRLLNYVTIDNDSWDELSGIPMQVTKIKIEDDQMFPDSTGSVTVVQQDGFMDYSQFDEFIKPIRITEKWLLNFGFTHHHDTPHPNRVFRRDYKEGFFELEEIINFWYGGNFTSVEVKHVHQLQNLFFALTGNELL